MHYGSTMACCKVNLLFRPHNAGAKNLFGVWPLHWVWLSCVYRCIDHMLSTFLFSLLLSVKRIRRRRIPRDHRCIRRLRLQTECPGSDEVGRGVWAQFLLPAVAAGQADVDGETESQVTIHTNYTLCDSQLWSVISVSSNWIKLLRYTNTDCRCWLYCGRWNDVVFRLPTFSYFQLLLLPYICPKWSCKYTSEAEFAIRSNHNALDQRFSTDRTGPKSGFDWVLAERKCWPIMQQGAQLNSIISVKNWLAMIDCGHCVFFLWNKFECCGGKKWVAASW